MWGKLKLGEVKNVVACPIYRHVCNSKAYRPLTLITPRNLSVVELKKTNTIQAKCLKIKVYNGKKLLSSNDSSPWLNYIIAQCAFKMNSISLLVVHLLPFMRCNWDEVTFCSCPPSASCRPSLLQAGSWHCCCLPTWVWGSGVQRQCTPVGAGQGAAAWCGPAGEGRKNWHQSHSLPESANWHSTESLI